VLNREAERDRERQRETEREREREGRERKKLEEIEEKVGWERKRWRIWLKERAIKNEWGERLGGGERESGERE
jgi:hypothetical protein